MVFSTCKNEPSHELLLFRSKHGNVSYLIAPAPFHPTLGTATSSIQQSQPYGAHTCSSGRSTSSSRFAGITERDHLQTNSENVRVARALKGTRGYRGNKRGRPIVHRGASACQTKRSTVLRCIDIVRHKPPTKRSDATRHARRFRRHGGTGMISCCFNGMTQAN